MDDLTTARQRPCSFAKDGPGEDEPVLEQQQQQQQQQHTTATDTTLHTIADAGSLVSRENHSRKEGGGRRSKMMMTEEQREQYQRTNEGLEELSTAWPGEGREGRWVVDEHLMYPRHSWLRQLDRIPDNSMVIQQLV